MKEYTKFNSHSWSACPEYPSMYSILAFTENSSPNIFTVFAPSTIVLPSVPGAWYPTNKIVLFGFHILCFKWCFILPTSHIPLAEIMIEGSSISFKAFDSSAVCVNLSPGNSSGLSPLSIKAFVSSSNKSSFSLKIWVAEIANGLST